MLGVDGLAILTLARPIALLLWAYLSPVPGALAARCGQGGR